MTEAALAPGHSVAVAASAGSGKTWLLTARIVRLLIEGASPGGILALTFTRKAAGEMQQRVSLRLLELARADDHAAAQQLREIGITPGAATLARARSLYEELAFSPQPLRATTLHAFCQELVARFALQTGTAPGFEIAEAEGPLLDAAWQRLQHDCLNAAHPASEALDLLIAQGYSEHQLREIVFGFLTRRNDWRALVAGSGDPLDALRLRLERRLELHLGDPPAAALDTAAFDQTLHEFVRLLHMAGGGVGSVKLDAVQAALQRGGPGRLASLRAALFKRDGTAAYGFKPSQAAAKKLGAAGAEQLLRRHAELIETLAAAHEQGLRQQTLQRSLAAATLGAGALAHLEVEIARQNRLPFAEIEWRACRLLADPEAGRWVQYRLDARIEHVLIDEFQDTSDTQWQLLLPLLQELAGDADRARSLFIVGDAKQSIYGFRRANPQLLDSASRWLSESLQGRREQLSKSWRSAPAIVDFINALFTGEDGLPEFPRHETQRTELWGRVELAPLAAGDAGKADSLDFRDPLTTQRPDTENTRAYREGEQIAQRIEALLREGHAYRGRALAYGDIMVLLRRRTHQAPLERALADRGIPFIGSARGTLLQTVELRDLTALLRFLASPVRDLDLAHALRSPLFGFSDAALAELAAAARAAQGGWWSALLAQNAPQFARAQRLLGSWLPAARRLPVHDLYDRILCESDAAARYEAALPPAQAARVRANLGAFAQLTLESDSGRYPSLTRLLRQLQQVDADEAPPPASAGAVRILTIHAAKGLEAPVVFLAQAACGQRKTGAGWLVNWPAGAERPRDFLLAGRLDERDAVSAALVQAQVARERLEELNLLYVACTRAEQVLHISGYQQTRHEGLDAHALAAGAMRELNAQNADGVWVYASGTPTPAQAAATAPAPATVDPRLREPLLPAPPSTIGERAHDPVDAQQVRRGVAVHLLLQKLAGGMSEDAARRLLGRMLRPAPLARELADWLLEARGVLLAPALGHLFDAGRYRAAWNEVPLHYPGFNGVLDRLVDDGATLWLLDYKTERAASDAALLNKYRAQLLGYCEGLRRLWKARTLRAGLLRTAGATWLPLQL